MSDEALMDVMDGAGAAEAGEHLRSCADCRERLEEARAGMALAIEAEVPEPSPLYWEGFSRQLGRRLGAQPRPWRFVLLPAMAAMAAGLTLVMVRPHGESKPLEPPVAFLPAWSPLPAGEEDPGLTALQSVAVDLEPEAECARVEECVADLSDDEGGDLAAMLRREVPRRES